RLIERLKAEYGVALSQYGLRHVGGPLSDNKEAHTVFPPLEGNLPDLVYQGLVAAVVTKVPEAAGLGNYGVCFFNYQAYPLPIPTLGKIEYSLQKHLSELQNE